MRLVSSMLTICTLVLAWLAIALYGEVERLTPDPTVVQPVQDVCTPCNCPAPMPTLPERKTITTKRYSHQHRSLEYMARACHEGRIEWNGLSATIRGE